MPVIMTALSVADRCTVINMHAEMIGAVDMSDACTYPLHLSIFLASTRGQHVSIVIMVIVWS